MAEEIGFENGRNSNFEGLVTLTLTLDPAIRHTVVHHSSTSTYIPNFIEIEETFCGRTDGRTDGHSPPLILLGQLLEVDLIITSWSDAARWEASRWYHHSPLVERQAWDVTVSDTYADAHVVNTAREAGTAANHAATNKNIKYSYPTFMCSFRWPLRQGVHGTIRRWNWYWNWVQELEDGRPTLQAMPGSPTSCSSSCPWLYRGEMRSHFKTRSPPASWLQSVVSFS